MAPKPWKSINGPHLNEQSLLASAQKWSRPIINPNLQHPIGAITYEIIFEEENEISLKKYEIYCK